MEREPTVDFDVLDPELANHLWERIAELRDHCPVGWSDQHGGFWLVNRIPTGPFGRFAGRLPVPAMPNRTAGEGAPGRPPRNGRPRPGSIFDPGAAGPGISQSGDENFLDGALDPKTGWPLRRLSTKSAMLALVELSRG